MASDLFSKIRSLANRPFLLGGTGSSRAAEIPFARLPRAERLRVSGKADLTEELHSDAESADGSDDTKKKVDNEAQEKRKMRGKGKSLKRYLRKQRKNVIDPTAVSNICFFLYPLGFTVNSQSIPLYRECCYHSEPSVYFHSSFVLAVLSYLLFS